MSYWHVTATIFITCRWTCIKQRRKLTFFLIRGNWIWFFIPSKHLFADWVSPINDFNPCIHLDSILYVVVTEHVIKVNEHNYQRVQIWGFCILFSDILYVTISPCLHLEIRISYIRLEDKRVYIKNSCRKHPAAMTTIVTIRSNLAFSSQL